MALFYDREFGRDWNPGYDRGYRGEAGWRGYEGEGMMGRGRYDRGFKSRWQTDYGDPFGDRAARTPMRMIRGEFGGSGDRFGWGSSYDRDYSGHSMAYDPYLRMPRGMPSENRWNRYDRGYRGNEMGRRGRYDSGWY